MKVMHFFEQITKIRRPSHGEQHIVDFLLDFAKQRGIEAKQDEYGNVLMVQGKSEIILQAHVDMVEQGDFTHGILLVHDGDWLKAKSTTLGADNGIGVATMLAYLDTGQPMRCLFTLAEETGLHGAEALDPTFLEGKYLINLDSEDINEVCIGCAGGARYEVSFARDVPVNTFHRVSMSGFPGGHSAADIDKVVHPLMDVLAKVDGVLVRVEGGSVVNAIPREVIFDIDTDKDKLIDVLEGLGGHYSIDLMQESTKGVALDKLRFPHGVIQQNEQGLDVSNNVGIMTTSEVITFKGLLRYVQDKDKDIYLAQIPGAVEISSHPGWPPKQGILLDVLKQVYQEKVGKPVEVKITHGGLECASFSHKAPDLELIAFGPTIEQPHSPLERLYVPSVDVYWDVLLGCIEKLRE